MQMLEIGIPGNMKHTFFNFDLLFIHFLLLQGESNNRPEKRPEDEGPTSDVSFYKG